MAKRRPESRHVARAPVTLPHTGFPGSDPGMSAALTVAREMLNHMGRPVVSRSELTPEKVRRWVDHCEAVALPRVLRHWPKDGNYWQLVKLYDAAFEHAALKSSPAAKFAPSDWLSRQKYMLLVLWSSCMSAAKTIAYKTRSGVNTPEVRGRIFVGLDRICRGSPLFRAGVQAAPAFKRGRRQRIYLDGVPEKSPVRRYA